jgi:hypothetical protein
MKIYMLLLTNLRSIVSFAWKNSTLNIFENYFTITQTKTCETHLLISKVVKKFMLRVCDVSIQQCFKHTLKCLFNLKWI